MICHTANLQGVHPVFARDTTEISKETFANRLDEKCLTILRAEHDMIVQRGLGIRHPSQPSLRDPLLLLLYLAINRQARFVCR